MYQLNKFCNIIFELRRERGWTQTALADRLGISPQSVSKWECGVGFPDVTLFPVIAELFEVSIGVLFGEPQKEDKKMTNTVQHECNYAFEPLTDIKITVGNVCNIDVIDGERETSAMTVKGDATFLEFLSVEKENGCLCVCIKNPSGSNLCPVYDRGGYSEPNTVQIYTGVIDSDVVVTNYLHNMSCSCFTPEKNVTKWVSEIVDPKAVLAEA